MRTTIKENERYRLEKVEAYWEENEVYAIFDIEADAYISVEHEDEGEDTWIKTLEEAEQIYAEKEKELQKIIKFADLKHQFYKLYKNNPNITKEDITNETIRVNFAQWKQIIDDIEDKLIADDWKFGTELEYGGYNNKLAYNTEAEDNIIQTIKNDGSVSGEGTEYNLIPMSFSEMESNKRKLESFCCRAANNRCTIVRSAGEHFHYSWSKMTQEMGQMMKNASFAIFIAGGTSNRIHNLAKLNYSEEEITFIDNISEKRKQRFLMYYKAFQWIYSTSNRSGTEHYGIGTDCTRGYTRHGTIELRCWRTTTDYRSIIARAYVGRFFLEWIIKHQMLEKEGFLYTADSYTDENIWDDMMKDEQIKKYFIYLAFHVNNKHNCGASKILLHRYLKSTNTNLEKAIYARSKLMQEALIKSNAANAVKEMFNNF